MPRGVAAACGPRCCRAGCDVAARRVTVNLAPAHDPQGRAPGSTSPSPSALLVAVGAVTQEAVGDRAFVGRARARRHRVRPVPGTVCLTDALGARPARAARGQRGRGARSSATASCTRCARSPRSSPASTASEPWPGAEPGRRAAAGRRAARTCATSAASRWPATRSSWRPPAGTTCS